MPRRDPDIEIIELLAPDGEGFDTVASGASPRRAGPRWPIVVAAIAAVGVVVGVVVVASGGSGSHAVASTTLVEPSPLFATAPTDPAGEHFVLDDADLIPYSADVLAAPDDGRFYQLWSVSGPDSTWISVEAQRGTMPDFAFTQSSRHVVDGAEVVSTPSGLSIVVRQLDAGWWVEVRASAMSDTMLVKFAATLGIVGGAVEDGSGLLRTLRLRPVEKLASADDALYGRVDNESSYALGKGGGLITLHVAPPSFRSADTDHLGYFATALATDADGHVRGLLRDDSEAFVTWLAHGHRFTITGSVDVNTLDGFSRELAAVDENGWRGRMYGLHPDYRLGPFTVNGGGTAIGGTKWSAGVQQATRGGRSWFLWWWTLPQHPERSASVEVPVDLHGRFYADTVVVAGATYVFVSSGDDPERLPVMVTGGDGVRRTVRMSHVNGEQRLLVGVQRIDAPGEVTIEFGR